ncbi:ATP-binding protein [Caulobacter sp. KR2-114]|jgi:signal transduction histidine kinase/AmiR/NasT family two-component response regulator|uniref:ATP-binding protein n=1 Tax=Caulobacter sp. KR2-114 TaxID=3400912 RepID=UPI003C045BD6
MNTSKLDEEFNNLAVDVRRTAPLTIASTVLLGVILGVNLGWKLAAPWMLAGAVSGLWKYVAWNPDAPAHASGARRRLNCFADMLTTSVLWTLMALPYWTSGDPTFQVMAVVLLMSLIIAAQTFGLRSPLAGALFAIPPALMMVGLTVGASAASGLKLLTVAVFQALALVHLTYLALMVLANRRALRESQDALVRESQAAVAANQSKSAFLAMMSHELRTPLTGVLGMAHALTLTKLNEDQASRVQMLERSGEGLMVILNDILDISKIEAGKLELETIALDLHDLGQQVHALWSEAARAKGVTLTYDLAPETPRWVLGDPTRLRQIMNNLMGNALKFTAKGEVRLSIRPGEGDVCEVAVADTGLGISEAEQARLFQPFQQVDTTTARKFGGTGLGLAICRQLASLMGGEIGLSSREGEGSVFTLRAPLPVTEPAPADSPDASSVSLAGLRVLVADDNPVNLAVARAILEAFGASLVTAENGADALDKLGCEQVDVVLLDVHMPIMDGFEALAKIRAAGPNLRQLPVIALTADAMAGANTDLMAAGFDAVAPKPINPQQLVAMVAAASTQSPTPRKVYGDGLSMRGC